MVGEFVDGVRIQQLGIAECCGNRVPTLGDRVDARLHVGRPLPAGFERIDPYDLRLGQSQRQRFLRIALLECALRHPLGHEPVDALGVRQEIVQCRDFLGRGHRRLGQLGLFFLDEPVPGFQQLGGQPRTFILGRERLHVIGGRQLKLCLFLLAPLGPLGFDRPPIGIQASLEGALRDAPGLELLAVDAGKPRQEIIGDPGFDRRDRIQRQQRRQGRTLRDQLPPGRDVGPKHCYASPPASAFTVVLLLERRGAGTMASAVRAMIHVPP